jgi:hypothetical protein
MLLWLLWLFVQTNFIVENRRFRVVKSVFLFLKTLRFAEDAVKKKVKNV